MRTHWAVLLHPCRPGLTGYDPRHGKAVARRRGPKRAKVALARKLAGVLHRMWADGTDFLWGKEMAAAA